jgi:hypothetical protein
MVDEKTEQTFVNNGFGTVTSKRVIYNRAKGWFSGGSREDIPLQHVTAVRLETSRSILGGILSALVGLVMLGAAADGTKVFGALLLGVAVLCFWGSPKVVVNTAGNDLRAAGGPPWQQSEAILFVEALRAQLFKS